MKVSSNSEVVRGMALWKFFGALREWMLKLSPIVKGSTLEAVKSGGLRQALALIYMLVHLYIFTSS